MVTHSLLGMPQGSVLWPFGFPTYTNPLGKITNKHGVAYNLYADGMQMYIAFDLPNSTQAAAILNRCIEDVRTWMHNNILKLNDSKTEYLIVGTKSNLKSLDNAVSSLHIGGTSVNSSNSVRNIGAIFDSNLNRIM